MAIYARPWLDTKSYQIMEGSWVFLSEGLLRAGSTVIEFKQQVRLIILQERQSEKKMDNKAVTKVWEKEMSQLDFL